MFQGPGIGLSTPSTQVTPGTEAPTLNSFCRFMNYSQMKDVLVPWLLILQGLHFKYSRKERVLVREAAAAHDMKNTRRRGTFPIYTSETGVHEI